MTREGPGHFPARHALSKAKPLPLKFSLFAGAECGQTPAENDQQG